MKQHTSTDTTITRFAAEIGIVKWEQVGLSTLLVESFSSGREGVSITNHGGSIDLGVSPVGGNTITGGGFGWISLEANGFIHLPIDSRIDADRGTIFLGSIHDITIGSLITTGTQANAIELRSSEGSIVSNGQDEINLDANHGGMILTAFSGIGHDHRLLTAIERLTANVLSPGSFSIVEHDSINLLNVATDDGSIDIIANGTITAIDVVSHNRFALDGPFGTLESRDIRLLASGVDSGILVGQITARNSADVMLVAGDDVLGIGHGASVEVIADDLEIIAGNATDDGTLAVSLSTDMNDLLLTVNGTDRGDAEIRELNSSSLASSDLLSDTHQLRTNNGETWIIAGDSIRLAERDVRTDLVPSLVDAEIIAGGANGRIVLIPENAIE